METYNLATFSDYIEGESEAQDFINTLADEITSAVIPTKDGGTAENKWSEVARDDGGLHVEYEQSQPNTTAYYKHTDGNSYPVYFVNLTGYAETYGGSDYILAEVNKAANSNSEGTPTGYEINVNPTITYTSMNGEEKSNELLVDHVLFTFIPNELSPKGYDMHIIEQGYWKGEGDERVFVYDENWDGFYSVAVVTEEDIIDFAMPSFRMKVNSYYGGSFDNTLYERFVDISDVFTNYTYGKTTYTAKPTVQSTRMVVLKSVPDTIEGITPREYFVLFEQSHDDFNYCDISYGVGFKLDSGSLGNPEDSYIGICDPQTINKEGDIPEVIDQLACHLYYLDLMAGNPSYAPPLYSWEVDIDGVRQLQSPKSHFFYGRDSTTPWVINKKRRADYLVRYWLSVNNARVALVIEGDPAPSILDYYRNFGYIGRIKNFNEYDLLGNFGVTVGMGDLDRDKTGFIEGDIKEDTPDYGIWGEYTSNGMWSMSMFNTRSNVFFQAHHPAFLTQLPNYSEVGTIPPQLRKLVLNDDRFQPSIWTSKYHGSPIYLVHRSEGYRGYLDGVVVVEDHNIVNGDELVVDTKILKDENDPSQGTWTEVYKFFSCNTPVNLFTKYSPAPGTVSAAILKEIK
ncbi:hypothetical protein ACSVDA_11965 [Cytobacillus sp. Hm23]